MNLECVIAHFFALLGEIGELLRGAQTSVFVPVQRAGVCGERLPGAAEHAVERCVEQFAGNVPEGDVDRSRTGHVEVPETALGVLVDLFPFKWIFADKVVGKHFDLLGGRPPEADVITRDAFRGVDAEDALSVRFPCARLKHHVERVVVNADILKCVFKPKHLYAGDGQVV